MYKVILAFVLTQKVTFAFGTRVNINANFATLKQYIVHSLFLALHIALVFYFLYVNRLMKEYNQKNNLKLKIKNL